MPENLINKYCVPFWKKESERTKEAMRICAEFQKQLNKREGEDRHE